MSDTETSGKLNQPKPVNGESVDASWSEDALALLDRLSREHAVDFKGTALLLARRRNKHGGRTGVDAQDVKDADHFLRSKFTSSLSFQAIGTVLLFLGAVTSGIGLSVGDTLGNCVVGIAIFLGVFGACVQFHEPVIQKFTLPPQSHRSDEESTQD